MLNNAPIKQLASKYYVVITIAIPLILVFIISCVFLDEYRAQGYGFAAMAGSLSADKAFNKKEYYFLKINGSNPSTSHLKDSIYTIKDYHIDYSEFFTRLERVREWDYAYVDAFNRRMQFFIEESKNLRVE